MLCRTAPCVNLMTGAGSDSILLYSAMGSVSADSAYDYEYAVSVGYLLESLPSSQLY